MHGDGSIRKRGKKYYISYYVNGKQKHEVSKDAKTEAEARRFLKKRRNEIIKGEYVDTATKKLTVNDILDDLYDDLKLRKGKKRLNKYGKEMEPFPSMVSHLKIVREEIGSIQAVKLESRHLKKLSLKLKDEGYTNSTVNRKIQPVIQAFNLAVHEGRIHRAIYFKKLDESGNVRKGFFEQSQYDSIQKHLEEPCSDMIELAYFTGWRKSEIVNLKWENIDKEDNLIRLYPDETKNSKPRSVPLVGPIKTIIDRRAKKRVVNITYNTRLKGVRLKEPVTQTSISEYVFHVKGKKVGKLDDIFKEARIKAGLPGKLIHDFRRTASRNLVRAGVPEATAMQITGHKTNSQFKRYNIIDETDKKNAFLALESRFNELKKARKS